MWVHKNTLEIQIKAKLSQRSYQTHWLENYTTLSERPHPWRLLQREGNVSTDLSSIHTMSMVMKIIGRKVTTISGPSTWSQPWMWFTQIAKWQADHLADRPEI